jgi:hypothetical protein
MKTEVVQDYKLCEDCGKYSPKGLRYDMDEPKKERKWKCDRCYFKQQ